MSRCPPRFSSGSRGAAMPAQPEQGCLKMKCAIAIAASLLFCWTCVVSTAATVTVDKPSPPPSCADGVCYPKVNTWGYYQRQWRPWPGAEELEPTPAEPDGQAGARHSAIRNASSARGGPSRAAADQAGRAPTLRSSRHPPRCRRRRPPGTTPPGTAQPGATPPGGALRGGRPATETPERREGESPRMPWDQSSGEWDPPPALPFRHGRSKCCAVPAERRTAGRSAIAYAERFAAPLVGNRLAAGAAAGTGPLAALVFCHAGILGWLGSSRRRAPRGVAFTWRNWGLRFAPTPATPSHFFPFDGTLVAPAGGRPQPSSSRVDFGGCAGPIRGRDGGTRSACAGDRADRCRYRSSTAAFNPGNRAARPLTPPVFPPPADVPWPPTHAGRIP